MFVDIPHVRTLNRVDSSGLWISLDIKKIFDHPNASFSVKELVNDTPTLELIQVIGRNNDSITPNVHIPADERYIFPVYLRNQVKTIVKNSDPNFRTVLFHK
jgi:hypothetical protein